MSLHPCLKLQRCAVSFLRFPGFTLVLILCKREVPRARPGPGVRFGSEEIAGELEECAVLLFYNAKATSFLVLL